MAKSTEDQPDKRRMKRCGRYLKIRGERWRLLYLRPPANKCDGLCDPILRTLWINPGKRVDVLATTIHEVLHACLYDIREETVEETEAALIAAMALLATWPTR